MHSNALAVQKMEVIEYKDGVLLRSSGSSTVNARGPMDTQDDVTDQFAQVDASSYDASGSNALYGTGTYSLVLKKRFTKSYKLRRSANQSPLLTTDNSISAQIVDGTVCVYVCACVCNDLVLLHVQVRGTMEKCKSFDVPCHPFTRN